MVTFCVKRHHVFFSSLFSRIFELLLCYNVKINKQRRREVEGRRVLPLFGITVRTFYLNVCDQNFSIR